MQKIKMMTDSTSDIDLETAEALGIKMLCFPVTVDGVGYRERLDFSKQDFYKMMAEAGEFPTTAQLTPFELQETYTELLEAGYSDVIYVTISSTGSATHQNAHLARDTFYAEVPGADKLKIHIVDSRNYTAVYGYPVMQAAQKLQKGASVMEVLDYLDEWFGCAQVLFTPLTLKYVKRSGRVSAAAAFAGELLGLRPLIQIANGESTVLEKIRGDKNIVTRMLQKTLQLMTPKTPYIMVAGCNDAYAKELAKELTKKVGYPPEELIYIGATVACNAGPDVVGVIIRSVPFRTE